MKQIIATSETETGPSHGAWGMENPLDLPFLLETIDAFLAESAVERTRRLADPGFKALDLSRSLKPA